MEQRISLITLGVADVSRARTFYERLGWRGQEAEETVFFQAGAMALILWGRAKLADDSGVKDSGVKDSGVKDSGVKDGGAKDEGVTTGGFDGVVLAHNVRSRAEVDAVLAEAAGAGGEITQPARETFYGGYAGCFRDPDGHVWEIAWNPSFTLAPDASIVLPDFGQNPGARTPGPEPRGQNPGARTPGAGRRR